MKLLLKSIILLLLAGCFTTNVFAQKKGQKETKEKQISISSVIMNEKGMPVENAVVYAVEGKYMAKTDKEGKFTIQTTPGDEILIEAKGFESQSIVSGELQKTSQVVLKTAPLFLGENDQLAVPFGEMSKRRIIGAVTNIKTEDTEDIFTAWQYSALLKYKGPGIIGSNNVRGTGHTVVVDGFVRDGNSSVETLSDIINLSEIADITVLKDVTSRMLYGSLSDAGIIYITTKRGSANKRKININYEGSMGFPIEYPQYLKTADYMYLYNEALKNDGVATPKYSDTDIANARAGIDPIRYPDQDYYTSDFLKEMKPQHRISAEFGGGSKVAQYYLNFGWYNTESLQKMGEAEKQSTNRFNVRGNVDIKVNESIKVNLGTMAIFNSYHGANYKNQDFWNLSTSEPVNAYPFLIPIDRIIAADRSIVEDAQAQRSVINNSLVGGYSPKYTQNIYGDIFLGGYTHTMNRNAQANIGVDVNLSSLLDGLSFKTYLGYDNFNVYNENQDNTYAVYEPTFLAGDSISVKAVGVNNFVGSQSINGLNFYRRLGWSNTFNYLKVFDKVHDLNITAMSMLSTYKQNNFEYTEKTIDFGLRANYMYANKYIAELNGVMVGSPRFEKGNQWGFSPAVGLGWVISEESFFPQTDVWNYLKVKASYGNTKTDLDNALSDYYLYQNVYNMAGNYNYGNGIGQNNYLNVRTGNPDISWVERTDLNIGLETALLEKSLFAEINYFNSTHFNEIQQRTNHYPSFMGSGAFIPYENYGKTRQQGFDASITYAKKWNDFRLNLDFNATYVMPKRILYDELDYGQEHEYRQRQGKASDAIFGLVADGLYTQEEIDRINNPVDKTLAKPTYGTVQAGDIKYEDLDHNGMIDDNDTKMIGNTQARFNYSLGVTLGYKDFNLFAYGFAETGYDKVRNGNYFWVYSEMKYPSLLVNRWAYDPSKDVDTRASATYPRLTTKNNNNNFRNSTFWVTKRDYFTIPAVQISYTVPWNISSKWYLKQLTVYTRGENLLTVSKDEYAKLNIGSTPQLRMYFLGVKAKF